MLFLYACWKMLVVTKAKRFSAFPEPSIYAFINPTCMVNSIQGATRLVGFTYTGAGMTRYVSHFLQFFDGPYGVWTVILHPRFRRQTLSSTAALSGRAEPVWGPEFRRQPCKTHRIPNRESAEFFSSTPGCSQGLSPSPCCQPAPTPLGPAPRVQDHPPNRDWYSMQEKFTDRKRSMTIGALSR